jgi:hypothetical protein
MIKENSNVSESNYITEFMNHLRGGK